MIYHVSKAEPQVPRPVANITEADLRVRVSNKVTLRYLGFTTTTLNQLLITYSPIAFFPLRFRPEFAVPELA